MCVAKERLIKDIGLGYNNLYITVKNCVHIIKHCGHAKHLKGLYNKRTTHNYNIAWTKSSRKPYEFEGNRNLKASQGCRGFVWNVRM